MQKKHIKASVSLFNRAFKDEFEDLFPDPKERERKAPYVHEYFLRRDLAFSEPFITSPSVEGIAIWSHSNQWNKRNFLRIIASGAIWQAIKIGYKAMQKMRKFDAYVENKHRELMPEKHWYLSVLAVDADYQGSGNGSQLIRGMLSRIDEESIPCYVETEGEKTLLCMNTLDLKYLKNLLYRIRKTSS